MCPLRLILIFLSATLAGFFVLRNLKYHPESESPADNETHQDIKDSVKSQFTNSSNPSAGKISKVFSIIFWFLDLVAKFGFWVFGNFGSCSTFYCLIRFAQLWSQGSGPLWTWLVVATSGGNLSLSRQSDPIDDIEGFFVPNCAENYFFRFGLLVLYNIVDYKDNW